MSTKCPACNTEAPADFWDRPTELEPPTPRYSCPECRSTNVQLLYPVWVMANDDLDDRTRWELDFSRRLYTGIKR